MRGFEDYDHWKTTNPADNELGPEPEDHEMTELHQAWELLERVREIAGARDDEATLSAVARVTEANREMLAALKAVRDDDTIKGRTATMSAVDAAIAKAEGR